ncbi:ricin-type beta-trefoil lectin domain protein [Dactylosporangium sp. CS-033363]|uniref:ricin-type beta-trefoil lectin domain protein n=1 Tax=Dactylosporangium sp. CS-033363 TaxID=3239935 RepID=UPI003D8FCC84
MVPTRPLSALLVAAAAAATLAYAQVPASAAATSVQVYWSSESRTAGYEPKNANWYSNPATGLAGTPYQLSRQSDLPITAASGSAGIVVDTNTRYQSVLGVGSSLEESTIFNLSRMSAAGRDRALRALVDPSAGAGFNVARITFGTSDFTSHDFYTYDDGAADPSLSRFSIQRDIDYNIIATLKQALAINPNLKIFASAWSAPPWMKTSNNIIGGSLNSTYIPTLAAYYRRAVQAYAAQGIPIYALTLQNEPLFSPADYPGMLVSADQERQLAVALRTELSNASLGTVKIWAFDHNFSEGVSYAAGVLSGNGYAAVDGIAFHDYAGDPSAMATVKANYPAKDVLMTERSVWGTAGADRIVQYFRNSATLYEGWVSMLDQNRSPERWSGSPDPTMLVQSTANRDTFWALPDYNMVAQFSKFVQAGAQRVSTGYGSTGSVTNVAFRNPDGTLVTVVVNQTSASQAFTLRVGSQQVSSTLPAKTVGTYLWAGADSGTPTGRTGQISGYGGKCVDVSGASSANGAKIQLWTCNGTTAQQWTVGGDGTVRALGKCLDVAAANSANGTKVQLYDCNGTTAQQWTAGPNNSLVALGKCLDATGPSSADGTQLQIWSCTGSANQQWILP